MSTTHSLITFLLASATSFPLIGYLDSAFQRPDETEDFEAKLKQVQGPMRGYIISILGSGSDADDVLQETNLFLFERRSDFRPGTSFKAWAFRIAYFKCLAHRRQRIRDDHVEFSEATIHLISQRGQQIFGEGADRLAALQQCLDRLSPADRDMLTARYSAGDSLKKFADRHCKSDSAIHKAISRLRLALRHCVEKRLSEP